MSLEDLKSAKKKVVGSKQTSKAIEKGSVRAVYIARDADPRVVDSIIKTCDEKGIPVEYTDSMAELGKSCGIEIGAASAAVLLE